MRAGSGQEQLVAITWTSELELDSSVCPSNQELFLLGMTPPLPSVHVLISKAEKVMPPSQLVVRFQLKDANEMPDTCNKHSTNGNKFYYH